MKITNNKYQSGQTMPIYEYGCQQCGHDFEEMQKFNDPPVEHCPECGNLTAQRKVSVSAFHLKGGGWYKDGYGSKDGNQSETSGESPIKDIPSKEDSKEDRQESSRSSKVRGDGRRSHHCIEGSQRIFKSSDQETYRSELQGLR